MNEAFSPSQDEAEYASRVVKAFEEAQVRGIGAISFEGKMIDYMNYKQAKDLVSFVEVLNEKEEKRQHTSAVSLSYFFSTTSKERKIESAQ